MSNVESKQVTLCLFTRHTVHVTRWGKNSIHALFTSSLLLSPHPPSPFPPEPLRLDHPESTTRIALFRSRPRFYRELIVSSPTMADAQAPPTFKLVLVGDGGTGKVSGFSS